MKIYSLKFFKAVSKKKVPEKPEVVEKVEPAPLKGISEASRTTCKANSPSNSTLSWCCHRVLPTPLFLSDPKSRIVSFISCTSVASMVLAHECFLCLPSTSYIPWMQLLICALHFHMSTCIFKPNNTKLYWLDEIKIRRHLRSKCWTVVMSFGRVSPGHQHFNLSYQHIALPRLGNVHCSSLAHHFLLASFSHILPVTEF